MFQYISGDNGILRDHGQFNEALKCFEAGLALSPDSFTGYTHFGWRWLRPDAASFLNR